MSLAGHPLQGLLDATVTAAARPSEDELDRLVDDLLRLELGDTATTRADLKRAVLANVDEIVALAKEGEAGQARRVARTATETIASALPEYRPPSRDAGKTVAEIVDSIPRGFA